MITILSQLGRLSFESRNTSGILLTTFTTDMEDPLAIALRQKLAAHNESLKEQRERWEDEEETDFLDAIGPATPFLEVEFLMFLASSNIGQKQQTQLREYLET